MLWGFLVYEKTSYITTYSLAFLYVGILHHLNVTSAGASSAGSDFDLILFKKKS